MKGDYEEFQAFRQRKNKANSKFTLSGVEWANFTLKANLCSG